MSESKPPLSLHDASQGPDVPTFSCIAYLSKREDGRTRGRVANLAGIECVGASEREVLSKLIPAFKKQVTEFMQNDGAVPWIDPPVAREPDEQRRIIPAHL